MSELTRKVNGERIPLTAEERAVRAAEEQAWEAQAAERQALQTRKEARSAMREAWDTLPAWIRGPYRPLFDSANRLLDEGDDDAAQEMIRAAEATSIITGDAATYPELGGITRTAYFELVKLDFLNRIDAL